MCKIIFKLINTVVAHKCLDQFGRRSLGVNILTLHCCLLYSMVRQNHWDYFTEGLTWPENCWSAITRLFWCHSGAKTAYTPVNAALAGIVRKPPKLVWLQLIPSAAHCQIAGFTPECATLKLFTEQIVHFQPRILKVNSMRKLSFLLDAPTYIHYCISMVYIGYIGGSLCLPLPSLLEGVVVE